MKSKKGISLIVLVITIIVMIILAATIIIAINNNNVVDKAKEAVDDTNLKQIQELAQTIWADAYIDGLRTQEDLEKAVLDGLKEIDVSKYVVDVTTSGVTVSVKTEAPVEPSDPVEPEEPTEPEGPVTHSGTIPKGATYYVGVTSTAVGNYTSTTATYTEGQAFPTEVQNGDVYVYGDYEYRYNSLYSIMFWEETEIGGWGVRVLDTTKSSYGEIIPTINNANIVSLGSTFYNCTSLIIGPEIPSTVTDMRWTFADCDLLTTIPILPDDVTDINNGFRYCPKLNTYAGSEEELGSFSNYLIPSKATNANYAFLACGSVKKAPSFNNVTGLKTMQGTFKDCIVLEEAPAIPAGVTDLYATFRGCVALKTAPVIPSSTMDIRELFLGCTNLEGNVEINSNPTEYLNCFYLTEKAIKITGSCSTTTKQQISQYDNNVTY